MPADEVAKVQNIAVVGQGGAGKTTVADALLFAAGAVTRLGRVDDGTSAFDTQPAEAAPPAELADEVRAARERLVETIAEANDALLEKYLEGVELTADELGAGLREGVRAGKFLPVLCGAAGRAIGLHPLLDAIVDLLPSPADLKPWVGDNPKTGDSVERAADPTAPFSAFVFKTIV